MPNILTDSAGTYAAADVFAGTKTNNTARLATDTDTYVTAQWGEEVDAALQNMNSFLVGASSAGQAGTFVSLLGGFSCAENVGVAGAAGSDVSGTGLAVGDASVDTNVVQIQSTVSSRVLFSSPSDVDIGALTYTHASNSFAFRADNVDCAALDSAEAVFGTGSAAYALGVDGGSTSGLEPSISFRQAGTEVASVTLETDGRLAFAANGGMSLPSLTTLARVALTQEAGHIVWDSDVEALFVSDGTTWSQIVGGTGIYFNVSDYGATGDGSTDDYTAIASAMTAASAVTSGVVYFPPGTYLVSQTLRRPSGVSMLGAGVPGTIIRGDNLTSQPIVGTTVTSWITSPTVRAGFIKNLLIDNQDRANSGAIGLELAGTFDCVVEGVTVQNVETGVSLTHSAYWNELRSVRAAVVDVGFEVTNGSNENALYSCHVADCEIAFEVSEGPDLGVSNNSFIKCAAEQFNAGSEYGYSLVCSTANAVDNTIIIAPRIERTSSGGTGINISGTCRSTTIENPQFINIATEISGALEDTRVLWRGQQKQGLRVGTLGDYSTGSHSLLNYVGGRTHLRNSVNSVYGDLQLATLWLANGARVIDYAGSPEGSVGAGRGSICLDVNSGDVYSKTTAIGSAGWSLLGGGGSYHYESFGFDTATSSTDCWIPFGSHLIETAQTNAPRAYHVWTVPFTGTISTVRIVSEGDPGTTTLQFTEPDGSTTIGVAGTGTPSVVSGTSGANTLYQTDYTFSTPVAVTAGQRILLGFNMTTNAGEVVGHIELLAS